MSIEKDLEISVDKILESDSVNTAQRILGSRSGVAMISAISFIESALPLPILTDPFLVAAILSNRTNTYRLIFVTTAASVVGGVFAFFLASLSLDVLLQWLTPTMAAEFDSMLVSNESGVFMLTLVGAVTPVPYTVVAWVVAVVEGSLSVFIAASVLGRGVRYLIVGYTTYRFGSLAVGYAKKYLLLTSIIVLLATVFLVWLKM